MENKRGVGVIGVNRRQHFDHVIPICHILGIPVLFHSEEDKAIAEKFFPDLNARFVPWKTVTLDYMKEHFDYFISSDLIGRGLQNQLRHIYCPHGLSDKFIFLVRSALEDITFVYGPYMLEQYQLMHVQNHLQGYVITGNYRYQYFKNNLNFYQNLVQREVLSRFKTQQPIVLYAPTWEDYDDGTTLFQFGDTIMQEVPPHYNLIVKVHPLMKIFNPDLLEKMQASVASTSNIIFTIDFLPVYPLLHCTDIFIGDTSSVGYDFLAFNRPMFLINKHQRDIERDKRHVLAKAGICIQPEEVASLYTIVENNLNQAHLTAIRQQIYQHGFGEERSFDQIQKDVAEALQVDSNLR